QYVSRVCRFKSAVRIEHAFGFRRVGVHIARIGIRVVAGELEALTGKKTGISAGVCLECVLDANVRPGAGLDAIVAGELVEFEQVGVVEDEALGVLIGQVALRRAFAARDDLADGFNGVGRVRTARNPGIGYGRAGTGNATGHRLVGNGVPGYRIDIVVDLIEVAAKIGERRIGDANIVDQPPAPCDFGYRTI